MMKEHCVFASMVQHMQISKRNSAHNMIQNKYDIIISIDGESLCKTKLILDHRTEQPGRESSFLHTIKNTVIILANKYTE